MTDTTNMIQLANFIVTSLTLVPLVYLIHDSFETRRKLRSRRKKRANTGLLLLFMGYFLTTLFGFAINLGDLVLHRISVDILSLKTLVVNSMEFIVVWWFYALDRDIKGGDE